MEDKVIALFVIILFLTLIIVRIGAYFLHDFEAYREKSWKGKNKDKSRTATGYLRRKTGFDIHHAHIGLIILILTVFMGLTKILTISLAVSLSLICDQIVPLLGFSNYFGRKGDLFSVILHLIVAITAMLLS